MAQQAVDRQLVLRAWRTLSPEQRQVLIECYFGGASVAEAAETLGVPPARSSPAPTMRCAACET